MGIWAESPAAREAKDDDEEGKKEEKEEDDDGGGGDELCVDFNVETKTSGFKGKA